MKKREIKSLQLNKKSISNLISVKNIKGGETNTACSFTSNRLYDCCDTLQKH